MTRVIKRTRGIGIKDLESYTSMPKWFRRGYEPSTEKEYVQWMQLWCEITGKTPDEIAIGDMDKLRGEIAVGMRKRRLSINSVTHRLNALNQFWKWNGRRVTDIYGGVPFRADIERQRKLTVEQKEEIL